MRVFRIFSLLSCFLVPTSLLAANLPLTLGQASDVSGPDIEVLSTDADRLELRFSLDGLIVEEIEVDGRIHDNLMIPGGGAIGELGEPALPTFTRLVAIPDRADVVIHSFIEEEEELDGFDLYPMTGYVEEPFLYDEAAYARDSYDDLSPASIGEPALMRDLRVVPLSFHPVRYNPASKSIKVARQIRIEISFEGENPVNQRSVRSERPVAASFDQLYRDLVINYDDIAGERDVINGSYVVICPNDNSVITLLQPLLDWRERQGYTTYLATTAETGTSNSSIKNWLQDAYDNWETPPEYISLAGDASGSYSIPTWYENLSGYNGEGDHPYVMLDGGDYLADAHIGRLSFSNLTELEVIINKIMGYETTPELGDPDWYTRACLVGDPNQSGYSTVIVQQRIKDRLQDLNYTEIDTIYTDPFVSQMTSSLNQGDTIFSYRGYYQMSGWQNSNTYALTNGWKMPFVVTITCGTGSFASGTARTEGFLRANAGVNSPKGGIASIGTATTGTHTRYNNCIHYGIFEGLLYEQQFKLGAALTRGKLEMYLNYIENDPNHVLIWSYWNNLMGDPLVDCWTGYPQALTVTHDSEIPLGSNAATVTVQRLGVPEPDATVCLLKDGETHVAGLTDAQGEIELPIQVTTGGEFQLTVTKHNRHPFMATVPVVSEQVYVGYSAVEIDDDASGTSQGNGDSVANPNESIELRVQLRNFGVQTANNVTARLTSSDPYVTITDADEDFGTIAGGATAWCSDDFDLTIDPTCPDNHVVRLGLDITSGADEWHSLIDLPVVSADLVAIDTNLYGAGGGGIFDPGETVELGVVLRNDGGATATTVSGMLTSESSFLTVVDGTGSWGSIPVGGEAENSGDRFTLSAAPDTFEGYLASFRLVLTFSDGVTDTTVVTLTIGQRSSDDPIGPDQYGYWAFDNTDTSYPDAPTYDWVEIDPNYGGSGSEVPLDDFGTYQDDSTVIDLPFEFTYYGETFNKATVCSNGWMVMGSTWLVNYRNWLLPAAGSPDGMLAVFWDDLRLQTGGRVYQYYDSAGGRFIVEWSRVRNEPGGTQTVEIILYDPAAFPTGTGDGIIEFQYNQVSNNDSGDNYATAGIESPDGMDGLTYTYYNDYPLGAATLTSGRAIRFLPVTEIPMGLISGQVRNASYGGVGIGEAEITLVEIDRTFVTGPEGNYSGSAPGGIYTVTASHPGFEPQTIEDVAIDVGTPVVLDFELVDISGPIITTTTQESTSDTSAAYPIPITISEYSGLPQKNLYWKIYGETFNEVSLEDLGENNYLAEIPKQHYISIVEYYVYARDGLGYETYDPPGAPEEVYSFFVTPLVDLFSDDMEGNQGWTVGGPDDDATTGIWERVDPEGTYNGSNLVQPEDDHTEDPGVLCFVTGGTGGAIGDNDVDGGQTTLTSPLLDLTSYGTVSLRYYRWYSNDQGNNPGEDVWIAQISNDDGQSWVTLENTNQSDASWHLVEFTDLSSTIALTDLMRIRFIASDEGGGSIVEAAVDDISLVLLGVVDAPEGEVEPVVFSLMPSRPNPSRGGSTIHFSLERETAARLVIYDVAGRTIRTLVDGLRPAGQQSIEWDGRSDRGTAVPSGVYFYRLEAGGHSDVRKLLRLE